MRGDDEHGLKKPLLGSPRRVHVRHEPVRFREFDPSEILRDIQIPDVVRGLVTRRRVEDARDHANVVGQTQKCPEQDGEQCPAHILNIGSV